MVIQLLRYGADPSIADGEGYRALHLAILFQHMAIAAYLMAKGQVGLHTLAEPVFLLFFFFSLLLPVELIFASCVFRMWTSLTLTARRL